MMVILIAGMHAVGKTGLAGSLAAQIGVRHVTASTLISAVRGSKTWGEDKRVNEIEENQNVLIRALSALRNDDADILLDGHLILQDGNGFLFRIPATVFREVGIEGIVLLEVSVKILLKRLTDRDGIAWGATEVSGFVQAERAHARSVANELNVPLKILQDPTRDQFKEAVMGILKKRDDMAALK